MRLLAILFLSLASPAMFAAPLTLAVASNFRSTAETIADQFTAATGLEVRISSASTGVLYAQIMHGAPFDVFLAADSARPAKLEASGRAADNSRITYAIGRLVLWSADSAADGCADDLGNLGRARLAIANPDTAPFGNAAKEFLQATGHWPEIKANLVFGENVAQALHFAVTSNARYALVAASQLQDSRLPAATCFWAVPPELHKPVEQQAVMLRRASDKPAAIQFIAYLQSDEARATIRSSGYGVP